MPFAIKALWVAVYFRWKHEGCSGKVFDRVQWKYEVLMARRSECAPHLCRSRLVFSVRASMIFILVTGVWLGWLTRSAQVQREEVEVIEEADGWVNYDCDRETGSTLRGLRWPQTLVKWVGIDYFGNVTSAYLGVEDFDRQLTRIRHLRRLEYLQLSYSRVTDAGLENIAELTHLGELLLRGTRISDAGLVHLKGLTDLRCLVLGHTSVTGVGFSHLRGLTGLRCLILDHAPITDASLAHLKGLSDLVGLSLAKTKISDAGIANLSHLNHLQSLNLYGTEITDAGLNHLAGLSSLQELDLEGTKVTEVGARISKSACRT